MIINISLDCLLISIDSIYVKTEMKKILTIKNDRKMKNLDLNMQQFRLPIRIKSDNDYYTKLKRILEKYCEYVDGISDIDRDCKKRVKENCKEIKKCLQNYYNANIICAQESILNILNKYKTSKFIVNELDKNYAFRGIADPDLRVKKHDYKELYQKMLDSTFYYFKARLSEGNIKSKEMLHIPFNRRQITTTQRYSIAGVPCMYLTTTSFGAWIEMGMPESDIFNVSAYKLPSNLKILNLCQFAGLIEGSSSRIEDIKEFEAVKDFIEIFPLVIATSFSVAEQKRSFKSEYIVSQLVMQAAKSIGLDGVAYNSKKIDDVYAYPVAVNLALLMTDDIEKEDEYWQRATEVQLTEPKKYFSFLKEKYKPEIDLKKQECESYINKIYCQGNDLDKLEIEICGNKFNYIESSFAKFDEYLVKQKFENYQITNKK